jgi:uncharacterized protein YbdZ (MbtH family)
MNGIVVLKVKARIRGEGPLDAILTNDREKYGLPVATTVPAPSAKVSLVVENKSLPKGWEIVPEGQWAVVEVVEVVQPDR